MTLLNLNDLLVKAGTDPKTVLALRHVPEPGLREVFPWLAAEHPEIYNAYQQTHGSKVEKAMQRADYIASFIGNKAGQALFIGIYRRGKWRPLTYEQYWRKPEYQEMKKLGMRGMPRGRGSVLWFDLELTNFYNQWKGRLVVDWPPPDRSWWRWADRNTIAVSEIREKSILDKEMPHWSTLVLTWEQLKLIPESWKTEIRQWRGIYYIFDENDGKGYVGSAYGKENILGRWLNYTANGHGGNKGLRKRRPKSFHFSILQRVSPDMEQDEIIKLESTWKDRLHTREFGINEN